MRLKDAYSSDEMIDALGFAGVFFVALIAIQLLISVFSLKEYEGYLKWIPYLSVLIIFSLVLTFKEKISTRLGYAFSAIFIAILYWAIVKKIFEVLYVQYYPDEIFLTIILLIFCSMLLIVYPMFYKSQRINFSTNFILSLISIFVFQTLSWISLFDLNNWVNYRLSLVNEFYYMLLASIFVLFFINYFYEKLELRPSLIFARLSILRLGMDSAAVSLFVILSFRFDSLFQLDSSYNWEYFVGVIRGLNGGGILLFNIPSQYGFLNLILASKLSLSSEWQAFYLFQSLLLFIVASSIYVGFRTLYKFKLGTYLFTIVSICLGLFFADTSLIGPYLFPSSSVTRFFWVYIFLCVAWISPTFSKFQSWFYAACWPIAFLWSAESAFYSTSIIGFMIVGLMYQRNPLAKIYIQKLLFSATLAMLILYYIYWLQYGMTPEILNLFEFALGYASGYGALKLPNNGPLMMPLLIFVAILIVLHKLSKQQGSEKKFLIPLFVSLGCIWSVSSYYIGRPAHQNITALIPIFSTVLYFSSSLVKIRSTHWQSIYLRAIALPFFFIVIIRIFMPGWTDIFYRFKAFTANIEDELPVANNNYKQLIESVDLKKIKSVAYLGEEVSPPLLRNELGWLNHEVWIPVPLYLLYPPTSHPTRLSYLRKYFCVQSSPGGAIIGKQSDHSSDTVQFLNDIGYFFETRTVNSNSEYWSVHYEGFKAELCWK